MAEGRFCQLPWSLVEIHGDGAIFMCCQDGGADGIVFAGQQQQERRGLAGLGAPRKTVERVVARKRNGHGRPDASLAALALRPRGRVVDDEHFVEGMFPGRWDGPRPVTAKETPGDQRAVEPIDEAFGEGARRRPEG